MPEMSFKPDLPEDLYDEINWFKEEYGVSKTHMVIRALDIYMDIAKGKARLVYVDERDKKEVLKHA